MKILVTGGLGYIATTLVKHLLENTEHELVIIDRMDYEINPNFFYKTLKNERITFKKADINHIEILYPLVKSCDIVVHLAALVGEPICDLKKEEAFQTNQIMSEMIGEICHKEKKKMIFMSTASNYGKSSEPVDESSELLPISVYAISKVNAEKFLLNNIPEATILRCATAYGLSEGRMRFDILLNEFVRDVWKYKKLKIFQPDAHRPLCHVSDIAEAIRIMIDNKPLERIYNVGGTNHTKLEIANEVINSLGGQLEVVQKEDKRDYRVSFDRIREEFNFYPKKSISNGINEMWNALQTRNIDPFSGNVFAN